MKNNAPYTHADGSNCWTENCSRGNTASGIQNLDINAFLDQEKPAVPNVKEDPGYRNVRKMPALFVINRETHEVYKDINPKAAWLFTTEATPTIKRDGTGITVDEAGKVYARRSVKKGKQAPEGYIEAELDPNTGHSFGIEPIEQSGFYKMFLQASKEQDWLAPGTYELCGPKINNNPESLTEPKLFTHGSGVATEIPSMVGMKPEEAYDTLLPIFADYKERGIEGVVWATPDGNRVKLRVKDFFGDPYRR